MKRKRIIKRALLLVVLAGLGYAVYYCWYSFPIISGYSAKIACSCAFIQDRTKESIEKEELGSMPLSLGSIKINSDGFGKKKSNLPQWVRVYVGK
jgi:hypothetical protein